MTSEDKVTGARRDQLILRLNHGESDLVDWMIALELTLNLEDLEDTRALQIP